MFKAMTAEGLPWMTSKHTFRMWKLSMIITLVMKGGPALPDVERAEALTDLPSGQRLSAQHPDDEKLQMGQLGQLGHVARQ